MKNIQLLLMNLAPLIITSYSTAIESALPQGGGPAKSSPPLLPTANILNGKKFHFKAISLMKKCKAILCATLEIISTYLEGRCANSLFTPWLKFIFISFIRVQSKKYYPMLEPFIAWSHMATKSSFMGAIITSF